MSFIISYFSYQSLFAFSYKFLILVVLISGGYWSSSTATVEIYNPATNTGYSLPQSFEARYWHTQDGGLVCGGGAAAGHSPFSCDKWNSDSGTWTQSHTLRHVRQAHVSWETENGVYLMGGWHSKNSTELVKKDGTVEDGFSLKYDTE